MLKVLRLRELVRLGLQQPQRLERSPRLGGRRLARFVVLRG